MLGGWWTDINNWFLAPRDSIWDSISTLEDLPLICSSAERRRVEVLWKRFLKNWQTNNQQQFTRTISWPFPSTRYMKILDPSFSSLCSFLGSFFFVLIIVQTRSRAAENHIIFFTYAGLKALPLACPLCLLLCSPKKQTSRNPCHIRLHCDTRQMRLLPKQWYIANVVQQPSTTNFFLKCNNKISDLMK